MGRPVPRLPLFSPPEILRSYSPGRCLYSYCADNTATGIALAKGRLKTLRDKPLVCRAHGYDVFEQARGIFFPARPQALERIDRVFLVSFRESYLKRYPAWPPRIGYRHLGVDSQAVPPREAPQKVLRIVSCANVIALKRIDLTGEFLKRYARLHPETQIRWTHFGTGGLLEHVKTLAEEDAPENFHAVFEGAVENREILRRYVAGEFDVFVSLSRSEGMPVSAIEAMSCGIVPLCTDAGGTRDAVDASCGALLPVGLTAKAFAEALDSIREHYGTLSAAALEKQRRDLPPETTTRLSTAPWIPWQGKSSPFPEGLKQTSLLFFPVFPEISRSQTRQTTERPSLKGTPELFHPFPGADKKKKRSQPNLETASELYTKP